MSNVFYAPGPRRAEKVGDLFAAIARRYDRINDLQSFGLHRRWKRRVVQLAGARPGDRALDVCCGTGDLAFALREAGAEVVGLDFSEPMVAIAKSKTRTLKSRIQGLQFLRGDAQKIPIADGSFNIVTVGYGLRNLSNWETGLGEMARVAKRGGQLLVLDFGKPESCLWRAIYFGYLRLIVPLLGFIFCHNSQAYAYILESLKHYPAQHGVEAKMRELGLTRIRIVNLLGGAMSINIGQKAG